MSGYLSWFGPAVLNHLWQSTLFAAVAGLAAVGLRRNPARVRYMLWLAASVKFLLPFSLLVGAGSYLARPHAVVQPRVQSVVNEVSAPLEAFVAPVRDVEAPAAAKRGVARRPERSVAASVAADLGPQQEMEDAAANFAAAGAAPEVRVSWRERVREWLPMMLAGAWLAGLVAVLMVWLVRWRRVAAAMRAAVVQVDGREVEILRGVEGDGRGVPLMLSGATMEPGIFGVVRPVLLWPEGLSEKLDDEHIAAIMTHELVHVRRRDNLAAMLHMVVEAAFWFHPMVWWMERRMVEERERACDEAVIEMGGRAEVYAESLLKACRFCVESPLACVAGITGADLSKRVRSIMTLRLQRLSLARKVALAGLALGAVAVPVMFGQVMASLRMSGKTLPQAMLSAAPKPLQRAVAAAMPEMAAPMMEQPAAFAAGQAGVGALGAAVAEMKDHRVVVMFFDLSSLTAEDGARVVAAASEYVNTQMQAGDQVSLVSLGASLNTDQDFTSDKAALLLGLEKYRGEKEAGGAADAGRAEAAMKTIAASLQRKEIEPQPEKRLYEANVISRESYYQALANQHKSMLYFTGEPPRRGAGDAGMRQVTDAAAKADMAIYTVDVRGLVGQAGGDGRAPATQGELANELKGEYAKWVDEDVHWIISDQEKTAFLALQDDQEREAFREAFWERRNPNPAASGNAYRDEIYQRIGYANVHFSYGSVPGWKSDRGMISIKYGKPDDVESRPAGARYTRPGGGETAAYPFEVWHYKTIPGVGDNIDIQFVDACRCGEFRMQLDRASGSKGLATLVKMMTPQQPQAGVGARKISSGVMYDLIAGSDARYPQAARARGVEGDVVLRGAFGEDGKLSNLQVMSGPELLRSPALGMMQGWQVKRSGPQGMEYRSDLMRWPVELKIIVEYQLKSPIATVGGEPVIFLGGFDQNVDELVSRADLREQFVSAQKESKVDLVHLDSGLLSQMKTGGAKPVYPQAARAGRVQGDVVVHLLISPEGKVSSEQVINGPEILRQAAVDAVKTWTYRPYMMTGRAVSVEGTIVVSFSLDGPLHVGAGQASGDGTPASDSAFARRDEFLTTPTASVGMTRWGATVGWDALQQLKVGVPLARQADALRALDGKVVSVEGFAREVPGGSAAQTSEFLLIPYTSAGVPAPPANQKIHVKMQGGVKIGIDNPMLVTGKLTIVTTNGPWGQVSYEIEGTSATAYLQAAGPRGGSGHLPVPSCNPSSADCGIGQ